MADVIEIDWTTEPPTVTERAFTAEEKAQIEKDKKEAADREARIAVLQSELTAKKTELLAKLGITEDEAKILLS